jgi:phosphoglycolate phosphatase-like HAD superfamily hydrolase
MKNRLAIFDIDGTLIDSVLQHQSAFLKALEKFGLFSFNNNWSDYKHHTDNFIFKTIFEAQFKTNTTVNDLDRFEDILSEFVTEATITNKVVEIRGAKYFLEQIANDFDIVFATGSLLKPAKYKLQQTEITIDEKLIVAANKILSRDELVLKSIETAKHFYTTENYEQIISFGDGLWDYETAKNLNIDFIGIGNSKLQEYGVINFFSDFTSTDLFKLMKNKLLSNFEIKSTEKISKAFTENNIYNFQQAIDFTVNLPYGRNANKEDLTTVFNDGCGTCSTKHALLKQLAIENNFANLKLILGIVKMKATNTSEIAETLTKYGLEYIPEAHNYLKFQDVIFDFTKSNFTITNCVENILEEIEILPNQITDFKIAYHKKYLDKWLQTNSEIKFTLNELWEIRELCIKDLETKKKCQ